ncbi:MAG: DUF309 domain-containing protein [Gemmataceae bacterium]|nr:DUF309 domain-containing protein [Gemmataceae bacterium]
MPPSLNPLSSMSPRRLLPDEPLPPYGYVPGRFPHPVSDPAGHSYGVKEAAIAFDPDSWRQCRAYLRGIDLFNHGYYWEAHEAWEQLWHATGKHGVYADFFKGLVQLAVAGVKVRQGIDEAVRSHARRAAELFRGISKKSERESLLGLELEELITFADSIEKQPPTPSTDQSMAETVFSICLSPHLFV